MGLTPVGVGENDRWFIQRREDETYQVVNDQDGDGVGDSSEVMTEEQVNAFLKTQGAGFIIVNGVQVAVDGYSGPSTVSYSPAFDFDGPAPLPIPSGSTVPTPVLRDRVNALQGPDSISDAALLWTALLTLADVSAVELKNARMSKALQQEQKAGMKMQEIKATEAKIEKMKESAEYQFWFSVGTAAVSFAVSCAGAAMSAASAGASTTGGQAAYAVGKGLEASGNAMGQIVSAGGNWWNVEHGPKADENRLEMKAKRLAMVAEALDQAIEEKSDTIKEVQEQRKQALRIIDEHCDRETQFTRQLFS